MSVDLAVMTVGEATREAALRLRRAGIDGAALDARILMRLALDVDDAGLILAQPDRLAVDARARFDALIARRERREPVAYIAGRREFWSLDFAVTPATLIPRPDSETLVAAAIEHLGDGAGPVLDLGTGSGCLLLAILCECRGARGVGIDRSAAAIAVARANAERLGLAERVDFVVGDWGEALGRRFAVIVANPPYIAHGDLPSLAPEIQNFEPRSALDGGEDGLDAYRAIARGLGRWLRPDGAAFIEIGAGQADSVAALFAAQGWPITRRGTDLAGVERCLVATLAREVGPGGSLGLDRAGAGD